MHWEHIIAMSLLALAVIVVFCLIQDARRFAA